MLITSLEEANKIVNQFKDLRWDGWDIISIEKNPDGYMNKNGIFIDGAWAIRKKYIVKRSGWSLPNKYKGVNNG
jgi:hypothetical protein